MTVRRLHQRLRPIGARLLLDPRLGTWAEAVWLGEVFGIDPMEIVTEGLRLLQLFEQEGAETEEARAAIISRSSRLRPQVSKDEAERRMAARPHRLADVYWAVDAVTGTGGSSQ